MLAHTPRPLPFPMESSSNQPISLPPAVTEAVNALVAQGKYSTASEYVAETVRADLERREKDRIVRLVEEGLRSPAVELTPEVWENFMQSLRTKHGIPVNTQHKRTA